MGADPNWPSDDGFPPIIAALSTADEAQGDLAMVDLLPANGADPNEITRIDDLETVLEVASAAGHEAVAQRLEPLTVRLDWEQASLLLSALMLAVVAGHHSIARTLVRAGADTTITGSGAPGFHGKSAGDLARDRDDERLAAFILANSRD